MDLVTYEPTSEDAPFSQITPCVHNLNIVRWFMVASHAIHTTFTHFSRRCVALQVPTFPKNTNYQFPFRITGLKVCLAILRRLRCIAIDSVVRLGCTQVSSVRYRIRFPDRPLMPEPGQSSEKGYEDHPQCCY